MHKASSQKVKYISHHLNIFTFTSFCNSFTSLCDNHIHVVTVKGQIPLDRGHMDLVKQCIFTYFILIGIKLLFQEARYVSVLYATNI